MHSKHKEVGIEKKYTMPGNLIEINFDDKTLVISVETANWIVLDNDKQKEIFLRLKENSIAQVLEYIEMNNIEENELINVLTQLEAKKFEETYVNFPRTEGMYLYLTNECNLRCKHCYMYAGIKKEDELTTEEIYEILNNFSSSGGKVITFTGGEVTQRDDLPQIIKFSKDSGLLNTILTNGIGWTEELIEATYKYIDEIQISIDGYNEESNSKVRGKESFRKALLTSEEFFKRKVRLSIAITPLYEGLKESKDKYIEFGKSLIEKYFDGQFHLKFNYQLLEGRQVNLSKEENEVYSEVMHQIVNECYIDSEEKDFVLNHENNTILNNCGYGEITVAANGDIYFCNRIYELKSYGNIRDLSFDEIMNLSKSVQSLSNINNLKPCGECELKYFCGGGCRITNFPELIEMDACDLRSSEDIKSFKPRKCNQKIKEKYYRMMIKTNEYFYR